MKRNSFTRKERLKKSELIRNVFDRGLSSKGRLITIFLLKRKAEPHINRAAFIIRKNLYNKNAVLRNRFRRLLREAYRNEKHLLPRGYDIIVLATNVKKDTKSTGLEEEIRDVFKKYSKK